MPITARLLLTSLLALFCAAPALAQNVVAECDAARDPTRCAARQQAQVECREKQGRERQRCMIEHLPPPDCSKAEDRERCEARQKLRAACKGKTGKALRACLKEHGLH